jgi:hypothetical protein
LEITSRCAIVLGSMMMTLCFPGHLDATALQAKQRRTPWFCLSQWVHQEDCLLLITVTVSTETNTPVHCLMEGTTVMPIIGAEAMAPLLPWSCLPTSHLPVSNSLLPNNERRVLSTLIRIHFDNDDTNNQDTCSGDQVLQRQLHTLHVLLFQESSLWSASSCLVRTFVAIL